MSEYNGRSRDSEDSDKVKLLSVCGQREGKRNLKFRRQNNGVGCCLNQGVESASKRQRRMDWKSWLKKGMRESKCLLAK